MINYSEGKRRLDIHRYKRKDILIEKDIYSPVSILGFEEDDDKDNMYTHPHLIATQMLMCRRIRNIYNYSYSFNIDQLKDDLNAITPTQNRDGKNILIESIIELVKYDVINIKFITNNKEEYTGTIFNDEAKIEELKTRIKNNEKFKFLQELKFHNGKPMFWRFYESDYEIITSEEFLTEAREFMKIKSKGISLTFDLLAYYGVVANSMNAMNKDIVMESDFHKHSGSVNYTGQTRLANKTANNEKNRISRKKVNQLDQLLLKNDNIFTSVKARHFDTSNFEWTIYRSHSHESEALYDYVQARMLENKIFDILPYEYINNHNEYRMKDYKELDHMDGFDLEEFLALDDGIEENLDESIKKSSAPTEEKKDRYENDSQYNCNAQKSESKPLNEEIAKKISDPRDRILILKQVKERCDDDEIAYPDTYELNLAIKTSDYSMINNLYESHITAGKILQEDLQNSEIKNLDQKLGAFAAEQKVVRIYDPQPYDEKESEFDRLINEVRSLIN